MRRAYCVVFVLGCVAGLARGGEEAISHVVYFELKDSSPEAKQKLVDSCYKYAKNHEGVLYFSAGKRAPEFNREVNAKDWDVAMHIVFKDKKSHDKYQDHADHRRLIEENKANVKSIKVYDFRVDADRK